MTEIWYNARWNELFAFNPGHVDWYTDHAKADWFLIGEL